MFLQNLSMKLSKSFDNSKIKSGSLPGAGYVLHNIRQEELPVAAEPE